MDVMLTRRSTAKQSKKAIPFQYPTTALHNIAYLFRIIEDKHLLLAAIQHPVLSAAQPDAVLSRAEQPAAMLQSLAVPSTEAVSKDVPSSENTAEFTRSQ